MAEERSDELKAKNYAAMLGSVNVIGSVIDDDTEFGNDLDTEGKESKSCS